MAGLRLRAALPHRRRLRPHGHDPHHASALGRKALSMNLNFPDRLSWLMSIEKTYFLHVDLYIYFALGWAANPVLQKVWK